VLSKDDRLRWWKVMVCFVVITVSVLFLWNTMYYLIVEHSEPYVPNGVSIAMMRPNVDHLQKHQRIFIAHM